MFINSATITNNDRESCEKLQIASELSNNGLCYANGSAIINSSYHEILNERVDESFK